MNTETLKKREQELSTMAEASQYWEKKYHETAAKLAKLENTSTITITERDFVILKAMEKNLNSFLKDAALSAIGRPESQVVRAEITLNFEKA